MPAPNVEPRSKNYSLWTEAGSTPAEEFVRTIFAMSEMCYDPLAMPSLDSMYHAWLQPKYDAARKAYNQKTEDSYELR